MTTTTLKKIRDLIEKHSNIEEVKEGGITMYSFIDKETGENNGSIQDVEEIPIELVMLPDLA